MLLLLASLALADSITLDTGATIEGDLARYAFGGDCQLSVTEGELAGVILIVPCHRVQSFVRTVSRAPVPIGLEEEASRAPVATVTPAPRAPAVAAASTAPAAADPYARTSPGAEAVVEVPLGDEAPRDGGFAEPAVQDDGYAAREVLSEPDAPSDGPSEAYGEGYGAVPAAAPTDSAAFYDEPLFPADPTTPVTPTTPSAPRSPSYTPPSDGPRMAPRMDDPPAAQAPTATRAVRF